MHEVLRFSKRQKDIFLSCCRTYCKQYKNDINFGDLPYQIVARFKKDDVFYFTPKWSRICWTMIFCSNKFKEDSKLYDEYIELKMFNLNPKMPKLSDDFYKYLDLETRIRIAWDQNKTYIISFCDDE